MTHSPPSIPLNAEVLSRTPSEVIDLLKQLLARIEELEARLNKNSSNSSKPPSSDSPFVKRSVVAKQTPKTRKRKGTRLQCLRPTEIIEMHPQRCSCGCEAVDESEPYYIHQAIELPVIETSVSHTILYRGQCRACGKMVKAHIPGDMRTGFGPRMWPWRRSCAELSLIWIGFANLNAIAA